jgi:hypothetical protein
MAMATPSEQQAAESPKKRPGRPPKGDRALTAAERQRAYRKNLKHKVGATPVTDLSALSRVALVTKLDELLAAIDGPDELTTSTGFVIRDVRKTSRWGAAKIVEEIVIRYGLVRP